MEYYSAIKKDEIMPFAATWMDLAIIILSEVSFTTFWEPFLCGLGWWTGQREPVLGGAEPVKVLLPKSGMDTQPL